MYNKHRSWLISARSLSVVCGLFSDSCSTGGSCRDGPGRYGRSRIMPARHGMLDARSSRLDPCNDNSSSTSKNRNINSNSKNNENKFFNNDNNNISNNNNNISTNNNNNNNNNSVRLQALASVQPPFESQDAASRDVCRGPKSPRNLRCFADTSPSS